jgi:orotidine-5'-phosphate decarboxylase
MSEFVIVALDFESSREALALVTELGAAARSYKVGLQLLTEAGPDLVRELVGSGKQVFLDLKLHEIPNSVAGAVAAAGKLGVSMVSVHASAGSAVLSAAVEAALPFPGLKIVALTVITSLCDRDLPEIGLEPSVQAQVLRLARLAADCGCHGVVASAQEAEMLRGMLPAGMLVLTSGVQLMVSASSSSDQARTATPRAAARAGATHIVVGRAITKALDPRRAFADAVAQFSHD